MSQLSAPPTESIAKSYVPDLLRTWGTGEPAHRQVEGSLVSADISGFTALSERLAGYGREGAEELTVLLNQCFGGMIEIIDEHGGDVLKFGGDALLVLFDGPEHTARAAAACVRMRRLIERTWSTPLVKRVKLGISQGIHSGTFDLHLVDAGHRELLVVGPGMSATVNCEGSAERGQVLLSPDAAALLDPKLLGERTADGHVLAETPSLGAWSGQDGGAVGDQVEPFVPEWLMEQTTAGRVAEHRVVTVGFVFFGGVDSLLLEDGAVAVHERLQALATVTREATEHHGVYWLASDVYAGGGKIILAAGAPRSTGQDEDAAIRTAREILDADVGLPLRAGLNRGPVFMGDLGSDRRRTFTVMGDTVNLAARLMQKSGTGQLVASQAVLDNVPTAFELEPLEPFLVKGKTEPIHASLVGRQLGHDRAGERRADVAGDVAFVGRRAELDALAALVADARRGRGRVVDMSGEPGIGKTRLIEQLLQEQPDLTTLRAGGGLYSRGTPYFALSMMLRQHAGIERSANAAVAGRLMSGWVVDNAPELVQWMPLIAIAFGAEVPMTTAVEQVDPANRATKLRDVVVELLTLTLPGPTIFVVDDSHRLDEASEALFGEIAQRIGRRPWLLTALRRVDAESFASRRDDAEAMVLGALSSDEIRELALEARRTGLLSDEDQVESLVERGVTNPLFLLELVRAGIQEGAATPGSIEALVTARIDTLSAPDRLLLREAAVLGSLVDVNLLADATGEMRLRQPERWDGLTGFLFRGADGHLRFEQGLYREVAYQGLSYRRRRQLHADIGQVLERRAGENWVELSELLSLHFHHAGIWSRSWRYSVIAGDQARSKYAHAEAAEFYRRALEAPSASRPGASAVAAVAESLADALEVSGRFIEAGEALVYARRYQDDPAVTVRLLRKEGMVRERQGKFPTALRWFGRGLKATSAVPDAARARREEGELCLAYSGVRFRQGRLTDSIKWAHRAEAIAKEIDDSRMLAHSAYLLMIGYTVQRRPEAAHYRDVPLPLFEQLGDLIGQANVLTNLGIEAREENRWSEAAELLERSRVAAELAGDVIGAARGMYNLADLLVDQGRLDEAEPLLERSLKAWTRAGYMIGVGVATSCMGRLLARRGDFDGAREKLSEAVRVFESLGASHMVLEATVWKIECEVLAGNSEEALAAIEPVLTSVVESGDTLLEATMLRTQAWAFMLSGDNERAGESTGRCIALAEELGATYEVALALIVRGRLSEAAGGDRTVDHARARQLLEGLGVVSLPRVAGS
jgi:class 3 adenylate cyclase/tetratricopeptide (TPR) repeat protein